MNESLKALLNEQYKLVAELREENKRLRKTVVMQEMEYNQLLKSYNRLAKELEEAKANRSPFTIFKK
ncbi:hypothetical protein IJD44_06055 [bacterium]|nr:hypothetical protein [bacterium]